ncbi:DUF4124 domain-containing protein [Acinetobacter sp. NIPH 2100]|uniref:DUF4124 domain-containing protein n=1 Tax=Acinetobacter sp. NIPH 2100 TaxID=1217708 RepID=UPI0002CECFC1|nr:DUF4124 domain-containing protein [Acinetobacter sp. NIPH 2100]ENX41176.1 hypothetical protein F887_01572 [Acinetobacter sp. NIPH 2100]
MTKGTLRGFCVFILLCFTFPVSAQELYKCVTNQGTAYQSRPCSSKAIQRTTCTGSAMDGFNSDCRSIEQQRQQAMNYEKNAYTQDLATNKTKAESRHSEFQRVTVEFSECKQRIMTLQRLARYADHRAQLVENNSQFYAARVCTEDGSVYLSCNATTNTLLTQTSPTCPFKNVRR